MILQIQTVLIIIEFNNGRLNLDHTLLWESIDIYIDGSRAVIV